MNLGNLKWLLNQLTPEQLEAPALVYHAHFDRLYTVSAMDHMRNLSKNRRNDPIALCLEQEPISD